MVEILKPTDYLKIIDGLYELNDEMDIMQYLENYHSRYAEDNYHFSSILAQKIALLDGYDSSEDVQKYYYEKGNNDPSCKIAFYTDAPDPVIRFAKVYIDYLAYSDDMTEVQWGEDKNEEQDNFDRDNLTFTSILSLQKLESLYSFLVEHNYIVRTEVSDFLSLFDDEIVGNEIKRIRWNISHQGNNSNVPMFTLLTSIEGKNAEYYYDDKKQFLKTVVARIAPVKESRSFILKSLTVSFERWAARYKRFESGDDTALDEISIKLLSEIEKMKS